VSKEDEVEIQPGGSFAALGQIRFVVGKEHAEGQAPGRAARKNPDFSYHRFDG